MKNKKITNMEKYKLNLEEAKKNSIGTKKEELRVGVKKITKNFFILLTIMFLSISLCACNTNKYSQSVIKSYLHSKSISAMEVLRANDCLGEDEQILTLDVETYQKLLNEDIRIYESDLIGYYELLGEKESEKIVIALGYEGWNDYLIKHNYLVKGEPSIELWKQSIIDEYQQDLSEAYEYASKQNTIKYY